ncbi:hypothetical protein BASA81_008882 [Batrachochytrium salamandrivorans]|nr:hypothetical protein BASA81_008882 [Batrachochytrium salamandrivorans]
MKRFRPKYLGGFSSGVELEDALRTVKEPYYAVVARSNTGKSSLINALLGENMALVSNTPGRTRCAHLFQGQGYHLIDLPGYGYASGGGTEEMSRIISETLLVDVTEGDSSRPPLRVLQLMDANRASTYIIKDELMIHSLLENKIPYRTVLTKGDCLSQSELKKLKLLFPDNSAWMTSAKNNWGIADLREKLQRGF